MAGLRQQWLNDVIGGGGPQNGRGLGCEAGLLFFVFSVYDEQD